MSWYRVTTLATMWNLAVGTMDAALSQLQVRVEEEKIQTRSAN